MCKEQSKKPHSQHEKSASCNECVQNFRFVWVEKSRSYGAAGNHSVKRAYLFNPAFVSEGVVAPLRIDTRVGRFYFLGDPLLQRLVLALL